MQDNIFYRRVSSWVRSYRNPEALDWVRKFVDKSTEPREVKEALYKEINYKEEKLRAEPVYKEVDGICYLADDEYKPKVYQTRFGATCKILELSLKGHDVYLNEIKDGYRIVLHEQHKEKTIADKYAALAAQQ